jgi:hypothetical protein
MTSFAIIEFRWRFARDRAFSRKLTTDGEFAILALRIDKVPKRLD